MERGQAPSSIISWSGDELRSPLEHVAYSYHRGRSARRGLQNALALASPRSLRPPRFIPTAVLDAGDRHADRAAPFGPGAVVIAHCRVTQQILEHEPGMRRALANSAVGDHVFVGRDTL